MNKGLFKHKTKTRTNICLIRTAKTSGDIKLNFVSRFQTTKKTLRQIEMTIKIIDTYKFII